MTDQQHDEQHDDLPDDEQGADEAYDADEADEAYDAGEADEAYEDDADEAYEDEADEAYDQGSSVGYGEGYDEEYDGDGGAPGLGPLVAAGMVGVVTTLVLVLIWSVLGPDDATDSQDTGVDAATAGRVDAETASPPPTDGERGRLSRLGRCTRAHAALQETLDVAQPALDQWRVHVGAMNKLVLGEITLQQATEFWERTRLGAQRRVRDVDNSIDDLRAEGVDCPLPGLLAPGSRALPGCARGVHAAVGALEAAQVSVATWSEHIHHMDMLRLGQMTPEQATEMWLSSWQRGVRDLDTYDAAVKAARREDGCSPASSSP
jgi:hypothetical protein